MLTRSGTLTPGLFDVADVSALRELIPPPSAGVQRKVLSQLDGHAEHFAALTRFAGICLMRPEGEVEVGALAGAAGFATASDGGKRLWIADPGEDRIGTAFDVPAREARAGVLLLVPGSDVTLRANGGASFVSSRDTLAAAFSPAPPPPAALCIEVEEVFFHCAKALVRSNLWGAAVAPDTADDHAAVCSATLEPAHRAWLARAPFALLATCDADGRADISPRGDPPGFVRALDEHSLLLPDRPGNRLVDSFQNVLAQSRVALLALVPGEDGALRVLGRARLTREPELLADSAVRGKRPLVGLRIDVTDVLLAHRAEPFVASALWESGSRIAGKAFPTLGRVLVEQAGHRGLKGTITSRVLDAALRRDERRNLY